MTKRLLIIIALVFSYFIFSQDIFAAPSVNCIGLPWCADTNIWEPKAVNNVWDNIAWRFLGGIIAEAIKYVAIIAVISLMLSGIMYLVSWGEEEKVNRAKKWIMWSLVWVLLSITAYSIIWFINRLTIW